MLYPATYRQLLCLLQEENTVPAEELSGNRVRMEGVATSRMGLWRWRQHMLFADIRE